MSVLRLSRPVVLAIVTGAASFAAGCSAGPTPPPPPPPGDGGPVVVTPPPPIDPPPPTDLPPPGAAIYKRGSLAPVYQLTPNVEYTRFNIGGVTLADSDFQLAGGGFANSVSGKLDEVAQQIGAERGTGAPTIIPTQDRTRAQLIPFRGNPSDVDLFIDKKAGLRKAYLPLGGDLMAVGNEVASINLNAGNKRTLITVGVHPQRTAVHPAGLVFVCNQYSNYISIIDPVKDELLEFGGKPVEIKTEFYCTDLLFVPRSIAAPDVDEQDLYVANGWRGKVFKYSLDVQRNNVSNRVENVTVIGAPVGGSEATPTAEIGDVGKNPFRISLSQDLKSIFVANWRGGQIAKIDIPSHTVVASATFKAPVAQAIQANDLLLIPTTTLDRGYPSSQEAAAGQVPQQILAQPFESAGIDGQKHVTHPGAQFDNTKAMNFEDLRNGLLTVDLQLRQPQYYTDSKSPEPNFSGGIVVGGANKDQKVLKGTLPQAIVVNKGATNAWVAYSGSDQIQKFDIVGGRFRLVNNAAFTVANTDIRPFALALDADANEVLAANWGGETLQIFDANSGAQKGASIDLGYANLNNNAAKYPATTIEKGEYLYFNTLWSNNGLKSCASCHTDELLADGIEYANGATAPTSPHEIPANFNLATTDSYFWNGTFANGSYAALASDFQTRSNCELIAFGYVEGVSSDPAARVGDPNNKHTLGANGDAACRPVTVDGKVLAANFADIAKGINDTKAVRDIEVAKATVKAGGLNFAQTARDTDFYSVAELRIPANPLTFLYENDQLDPVTKAAITKGQALFTSAGCNNCHQANNQRAPFTDNRNHGRGANWAQSFITQYQQDPRVLDIIEAAGLGRALPASLIAGLSRNPGPADREINVHLPPVDFFIPGCFDGDHCLEFKDPGQAARGSQDETDRLEALTVVNLANADRGFVPGNVSGQPQANTPSLRANWWKANFLRHGLARSLKESILGPGHPELTKDKNGVTIEKGFAIDIFGNLDVHGATSTMGKADVDALVLYVQSIQ